MEVLYKIKRAATGSAPFPPPWSYTPSRIHVLVLIIIQGKGGGRLPNKGGGLLYEKWFWFGALSSKLAILK
jgi:hypothetical protein